MSFIEQYLLQLNTEKQRWWRAVAILTALSLIVSFATVWNLRMTGITIANNATCGYVEHQHTEECPTRELLICGYDEEKAAETSTEVPPDEYVEESAEETPPHTHTDECYKTEHLCGFIEHIHIVSCYSDTTADVETAEIWEATLPNDLGEYWSENLARIAVSQIGITESERNYIITDDGETKQGITRYGQWYGNPHGDWSAMFVAFCLHYADVPQDVVPRSPGVYNMMRLAEDLGICSLPDENTGAAGNILFLDTDRNGAADRAVIAVAGSADSFTSIGGDLDNSVKEIMLSAADSSILGYINVRALQHPQSDTSEFEEDFDKNTEETDPKETSKAPALLMNTVAKATTDAVGSYLTQWGENLWQIVAGGYEGREESNKQNYEKVHIQKNIIPTDKENEFLVYLSISKELSWKTIFDYGAYFASSANGSVGEIVSTSQGNPQALSVTQTGTYKTPFYMIIQVWDDAKTQLKVETDVIVRYTNKGMKNGKILLQIPGTEQAIVVANVRNYAGTSADNPVYVQLTENQLSNIGGSSFERLSVVDTVLDTVVDEMGDNIEFIEVVAGDYERPPTYSDGTLTWKPKTVAIDADQGTGQVWQNNAAQLVYKIRLKNDKSCGECLDTDCSVDSCDHVYPTNKSAVLTYHMTDAPSTYYTAQFQVPYVRGLLYDVHFIKIDQDSEKPIAGAIFELSKENDSSFTPQTVVSGSSGVPGEVSFTNLLSGTYILTETAAPEGYEITFGGPKHSMDIFLSYTAAPDKVMEDIFDTAPTANLMYKGAVDGIWKITNRYTQVDPMLPSTGGVGTPLYMLCGLILIVAPFIYLLRLVRKRAKRAQE